MIYEFKEYENSEKNATRRAKWETEKKAEVKG